MKTSTLKMLLACCLLLISNSMAAQKHVVKILAVGNSFSRDAVEQNLWDLAHADSVDIIVANLYIGGCPISRHADNARDNAAAYEYRKIGTDGIRRQTNNVRLGDALLEEAWDVVTVQQASHDSGQLNTYERLPELLAYIRARVPFYTKILFHQTWAYETGSTHSGFARYGNSQQKMFQAIEYCSLQAVKTNHLQGLIPVGWALQEARSTALGDHLCRDGYHLNALGQYVAACTWYEYVLGHKVRGNDYAPESITKKQRRLAQRSAHKACKHYRKTNS